MVPEKGAHKQELDERLAEARDDVLLAGEQVVAQEAADQGQAIVLTDSRIIILKVGITATGMLNGRKTGIYPLGQVTSVSVRKGPMGAVIQVLGEDCSQLDPGEKPERVVVFGGPEKVKCCDAIAAQIETALGKPIERVEPQSQASAAPEAKEEPAEPQTASVAEAPQPSEAVAEPVASPESKAPEAEPKKAKPRGGRVAKSLAEEMYGDASPEPSPAPVQYTPPPAPTVEPEAVVEVKPEPEPAMPVMNAEPEIPEVVAVVEPVVMPEPEPVAQETYQAAVEPEPEPEPQEEPEHDAEPGFRPNPNLPKPRGKKRVGPNKVLVLFGGLTAMVLMGLAITAPLRQSNVGPSPEVNVSKLTNSVSVLRKQFIAASAYKDQVEMILKESDISATAVRSAIGSGNHQAVISALNKDMSSSAWAKMSEIAVPMGLAGAKESIVSGLFIRKSAVEGAMTGSVSAAATSRRLADADRLIAKGTRAIDAMLTDLLSRMPKTSPKHK